LHLKKIFKKISTNFLEFFFYKLKKILEFLVKISSLYLKNGSVIGLGTKEDTIYTTTITKSSIDYTVQTRAKAQSAEFGQQHKASQSIQF